jgi:hypothetical protein
MSLPIRLVYRGLVSLVLLLSITTCSDGNFLTVKTDEKINTLGITVLKSGMRLQRGIFWIAQETDK